MSDTRQRLLSCFQAMFPDLKESELQRASVYTLANWDSVATLNLVALVEEEFGVRLEPEEIEDLSSFELYLARLKDAHA